MDKALFSCGIFYTRRMELKGKRKTLRITIYPPDFLIERYRSEEYMGSST